MYYKLTRADLVGAKNKQTLLILTTRMILEFSRRRRSIALRVYLPLIATQLFSIRISSYQAKRSSTPLLWSIGFLCSRKQVVCLIFFWSCLDSLVATLTINQILTNKFEVCISLKKKKMTKKMNLEIVFMKTFKLLNQINAQELNIM